MDPLQAVRRIFFDTPHYYPVVKATAPNRDTDAVQEGRNRPGSRHSVKGSISESGR